MSAMTTGPVSRAARAAVFAAVCVTTAALGHALMSAQPLPWWAPAAAFCATGTAAWWLAGRERGAITVTGSTVVAQLGLHSLFGLAQVSTGTSAGDGPPARQWAARMLCDAYRTGPSPETQVPAIRLLRHAGLGPELTHASPPPSMGGMRGMGEMAGMGDPPPAHTLHTGQLDHLDHPSAIWARRTATWAPCR